MRANIIYELWIVTAGGGSFLYAQGDDLELLKSYTKNMMKWYISKVETTVTLMSGGHSDA